MDHSLKKADLMSSALQIYLAHTLNQTEDIVRATREESSRTTSFFRNDCITSDTWAFVLAAAERVVAFIKECQKAMDTSYGLKLCVWDRLCVIDASQDALKEALLSSRCYSQDSFKMHTTLSEKYACKAAYLNYAYEAAQRDGDRQLSMLWSLAARNLSQEMELHLSAPSPQTQLVNEFLQQAKSIEADIAQSKHAWSAECLRLHMRALHHSRRAAVMTALFQAHVHTHAVEMYEDAAQVREWIDGATVSSELTLLERVMSFYQQAMDLVEVDLTLGFRNYGSMFDLRDAARRLLSCLPHVRKVGTALDKIKAELATTVAAESKCRDATMLRVWGILRAEQEKAILKYEGAIEDVMKAGSKEMPTNTVDDSLLARIAESVREISVCRERTALYKQRAALALQGARPSSQLANKCWTQAAVHMENSALVCIDDILSGTWQKRGLDYNFAWKSHCGLTKHFLCIVESALPRAVEYLDKARGAEAGEKSGRDPREAQMWRKAAECMVKKAETKFSNESGIAKRNGVYVVSDVFDHCNAYLQVAEYFHLAFKHRAVPDCDNRRNGARLAALYERAGKILCGRAESPRMGILDSVVAFHVEAFRQFGSIFSVSVEDLALWETASQYGKLACDAALEESKHWYRAFCITHDLLKQCVTSRKARDVSVMKARIALHVSAANTAQPQVLQGYEACLSVLEAIPSSPPPRGVTGLADRQYQLALVAQIIHLQRAALGPKTFTVPAEVHGVLGRAVRKEQRLPFLQDHAQMLLLLYKCDHQRESDDERYDKWDRAYNALNKLCDAYALFSVDTSSVQSDPNLLARLAYRKAVARCYVGAAESFVVPNGAPPEDSTVLSKAVQTTADAWEEAVTVARDVTVVKTSTAIDSQNALVVMERFLLVAEQAQATEKMVGVATEKNELMKVAQEISEMEEFRELAREVALAACDVQQEVIDTFNEIEARAKAAATELRRKQGMNISAYRSLQACLTDFLFCPAYFFKQTQVA